MPVLRVALAVLVAAFAFQSSAETGATGWVPMDDAGCEAILGFGNDEASNLIDRCPLTVTQEGDNNSDFTLMDDAHGNFNSSPPGRAANTKVFDFDGVDDYLELGAANVYNDEIGQVISVVLWLDSQSGSSRLIYDHWNFLGSPGQRGIRMLATGGQPDQRSWINIDTTEIQASFEDIPSDWTVLGGSLQSDDEIILYGSRCATNTMVCADGAFDADGVGAVAVPYTAGGNSTNIDELDGQIAEIFLFEIPITPVMACQICRSGYGNDPGNPNEPDDVIFDRAAFCATKVTALGCTLPDIPGSSTPATHVGPRRLFM